MKKYLLYSYRIAVLAMLLFFFEGTAQISMSSTGTYSQDFNTLISTGSVTWTDNSILPNWYAKRSGAGSLIVADTGSSNGGNLYSYGSSGSTDRALGTVGSGTPGNFAYGTLLQNNSSFAITDVKVSFVGEQWRNSAAISQTVAFYYKISSSLITDLQPNANTGWTAVTNLDFISPVTGGTAGALDGNNAANRVVKNSISIPSLNIPAGYYLLLKWDDPDHTGNDHGLAIDDVKIDWTINTAVKPEPTNFPTGFACGTTTNVSIPLSWTDAVGTTAPDGYLIKWSSTSYTAITDPTDGGAVANGANAHNVAQGTGSYTVTGLSASTPYYFKIWSYTNSGSAIDYKLVGEPQTTCTTTAASCNFIETFSGIGTATNYATRSWSGIDSSGGNTGSWSATDAREDQTITSTNKAITIRTGAVTSPTFNNGIGNLSFKTKFPFGETSGNLLIKVNGITVGTLLFSEMNESTPITKTVNNINISGNVIISLESSGARYTIDDLSWTCACTGTVATQSFASDPVTKYTNDVPFTNTFTTNSSGAVTYSSDTPSVATVNSSSGLITIVGVGNAIIKGSQAADATYCAKDLTYNLTVNAAPTISIDKTALSGFTYAFGQGPSVTQPFVVNGSNLAAAITATASANWEISTNLDYNGANTSPWSIITLDKTASNAVTNKTIHVRLKDGLAVGPYTGTISLTSTGAVAQTINLSGTVTAGIADMKVTGNGTTVANRSTTPIALNNTLFASQNIGSSQTKSFVITNSGGAPLTINTISISAGDVASFTILNPPTIGTVLNPNQTAAFDIRFAPSSVGTKNATISIANTDPNDNPYTFAVRGGATFCASAVKSDIAQQGFEETPSENNWTYTTTTTGSITPGSGTGFSTGVSGSGDVPKGNNLFSEGARAYRIQGGDDPSQVTSGVAFTFDDVDVSSRTGIDLSFKVAGFSLGSTGNGIDCNSPSSGQSCVADEEKADFVLVEISPDGGFTWYMQAKVVSDEMNLPWSFGSQYTGAGSRAYAADHHLTYFKSTRAFQYSAVTISGLPAVSNLKVRITAQDNAINESWILDDIKITSTGLVPKVWNGFDWLPSIPQPSDKAIINGDYITKDHGTFKVCQCEVKSGKKLTVSENTAVTVTDALQNDGGVLVESGGGLVQLNDINTNSGAGTFTAERKINLPSNERQQYNYLISPVVGINLQTGIYNGVSAPQVLYHNQTNNYFYASSGAYISGRALAVKEPTFATVSGTEAKAVFTGTPANGPLTFGAVNSNTGVNSPSTAVRGYNLIGNPYPSNMDLITFYNLNGGEAGGISSTFYFWDNTANNIFQQAGSGYSGNAYAQFNAVDGTGTKATGDAGFAGTKVPTRYVSMAQGFMSRILTATKTLQFSNSTRKPDGAVPFFGKNNETMNRFWLNMITPNNLASNIAVVYFEEGDNAFTKDDSRSMGGSDAVYSLVDGEQVSINGKSSFNDADKVPLGTAYFEDGNYTLALDRAEGIFANGQSIYVKDKQTNIITNLNEGNYTFAANAGESSGRFEIIYKPQTVLATDITVKENVLVYRDGNRFVVKASTKNITLLEVYDVSGRLINRMQPNGKEAVIDAASLNNGMYVLKVAQFDTVTTKKVIK